jgi:transposase-like protein
MTPQKKQGRIPQYDDGFKVTVAKEYFSSNLGYGALAKKYGLPHAETVRHFVRWYKKHYGSVAEQPATSEATEVQPGMGKDLKEAHLQVTALELLIKNASKELGVDILKKFGTKQPKK